MWWGRGRDSSWALRRVLLRLREVEGGNSLIHSVKVETVSYVQSTDTPKFATTVL